MPLNLDLFPPITNPAGAHRHLQRLILMGIDYHPDNDAATILNSRSPQMRFLFSIHEAEVLNTRMGQVMRFDKDPAQTLLDLYEVQDNRSQS